MLICYSIVMNVRTWIIKCTNIYLFFQSFLADFLQLFDPLFLIYFHEAPVLCMAANA